MFMLPQEVCNRKRRKRVKKEEGRKERTTGGMSGSEKVENRN